VDAGLEMVGYGDDGSGVLGDDDNDNDNDDDDVDVEADVGGV